jgi:hypothetical protein
MCYEINSLIDKLNVIPAVIQVEAGNAMGLHRKVPIWNLRHMSGCPYWVFIVFLSS